MSVETEDIKNRSNKKIEALVAKQTNKLSMASL